MAHIRLDDKRIELNAGEPRIGTGDDAQVRLDAGQEKGTLAIIMAGRQLLFSDSRNAGSTALLPALGAAASVDWKCPTIGGNRAGVSAEEPMRATLEVVTEGVLDESVHRLRAPLAHIGHGEHTDVVAADDDFSGPCAGIQRRESNSFVVDNDSTNQTCLSSERVPGDRALNSDTAVRFFGAKVIFRSEPEIVDADGATDLLVIQDC